jgi:hypothetical protein
VGAGSAFDDATQTVIVFGDNADTWSWTGSDWVQLTPKQSPLARSAIGMAHNPTTHQVIVFGGELSSGPLVNGTLQFFGQ